MIVIVVSKNTELTIHPTLLKADSLVLRRQHNQVCVQINVNLYNKLDI